MENSNGIDSKPRTRRGRRRLTDRLNALAGDRNDETDVTLNVRLKEREDSARRNQIGNILRDRGSSSKRELFNKDTSYVLKDTIRRPFIGLFRRPSSCAESRTKPKNKIRADKLDTVMLESLASNFEDGCVVPENLETHHVEEQVLHDIASAPNVCINRLSSMCQLDSMNVKAASLPKLDDIDLSLLSRFLCLEEEVKDEEVPWTWDYIFASVSAEMRDEWVRKEEHDDSDCDIVDHIK